jgi:hypothetical protein
MAPQCNSHALSILSTFFLQHPSPVVTRMHELRVVAESLNSAGYFLLKKENHNPDAAYCALQTARPPAARCSGNPFP